MYYYFTIDKIALRVEWNGFVGWNGCSLEAPAVVSASHFSSVQTIARLRLLQQVWAFYVSAQHFVLCRHKKCRACHAHLADIQRVLESKQQTSGKLSSQFRELKLLIDTLEWRHQALLWFTPSAAERCRCVFVTCNKLATVLCDVITPLRFVTSGYAALNVVVVSERATGRGVRLSLWEARASFRFLLCCVATYAPHAHVHVFLCSEMF